MGNEFKKYQHVERFGNKEVDGIEIGECFIFPKIDGTNASVWSDGLYIQSGSRNRHLTHDDDNAGFFKWASEQENIKSFLADYPNLRLYGEWLVPHALKTYRDDAWRNFYVFDVYNENDLSLSYEEYKPILEKYNIEYIPKFKKPTINYKILNHYVILKIKDIMVGLI